MIDLSANDNDPILQEYPRQVSQELNDKSVFKASNDCLGRFRTRYNIKFRRQLYNCDETELLFKLMSDRSVVLHDNDSKSGKRSKERVTVSSLSKLDRYPQIKTVG